MRRLWILRGIRFLLFAAVAVTVLGYLVMSLWNWLIPSLTGWHTLGFGQALALLVTDRLVDLEPNRGASRVRPGSRLAPRRARP